MSRLRQNLLFSVSHLAIHRAWTAQKQAARDRETAATVTPASADHDGPKVEALAAVAAARGTE
jgi:hypothetical protein